MVENVTDSVPRDTETKGSTLAEGMFDVPSSTAVVQSINWRASAPGEDIPGGPGLEGPDSCRALQSQPTAVNGHL